MTLKHDGKTIQHFAWNGQDLLSMTDGDKSYSYIKDGNKNVIELLDKAGKISAKYAYSPFGETISPVEKDDSNPYRFSSEQWDETLGLAYYNYRYYSPAMGRWLSRDPIGEDGGSNLYTFVRNKPSNDSDILGLLSLLKDSPGYACVDLTTDTLSGVASTLGVSPNQLAGLVDSGVSLTEAFANKSYNGSTKLKVFAFLDKLFKNLSSEYSENELLSKAAYAEGTPDNANDKYGIVNVVFIPICIQIYNKASVIHLKPEKLSTYIGLLFI